VILIVHEPVDSLPVCSPHSTEPHGVREDTRVGKLGRAAVAATKYWRRAIPPQRTGQGRALHCVKRVVTGEGHL